MRISANQVTLARLVLLPLPVAMFYRGTREWMLGALAVYVILGLTDAVDGILARRYGSTPVGELLDPIADKIFLVATYVPMSDFRIAPPLLVLILFVRELAVTSLRSIALEEGFTFRTSRVAKLKTTVQMAGSGFMFLIWLFQDRGTSLAILGAAAAGSLVPVAVSAARGRMPGWKPVSGAVLICGIFGARVFLPALATNVAIMLVIAGFTVYSGLEYVWEMRRVLGVRFRRSPSEMLRLVGLSLAVPLGFLPVLSLPTATSFFIAGIVAAELAAGGLDNSLVQAGIRRGPAADLVRSGFQAACGAGTVVALVAWDSVASARVFGGSAILYTFGEASIRLVRHRAAILAGVAPPTSPPSRLDAR